MQNEIERKLYKFFKDEKKVKAWLNLKNLNFGGFAPIDLIKRGRAHKVLEFINNALDENGDVC
jgi:hypothetical protein